MRPRVHSSVSNPNACGPLPSASATASSSAADSRGRRPARPAARSACSPPWRQRRYQTLAAWAETPKVRATSAWLAPWANMPAASKRRCSRPAKSRRQLPVLIGIADLHVRCPCLPTQHANPNYANQPIPRNSFIPDPTDRTGAQTTTQRQIPVSHEGGIIALLGLVSAHFDIPQQARTEGDVFGRVVTNINAGIAVVTPAHCIRELIESEPVKEERDRYRGQDQSQPAATFDSVPADGGTGIGDERFEP